MAFKAFYREDIRDAIAAARLASEEPVALLTQALANAPVNEVTPGQMLAIYRRGYNTALSTVARTFGVEPEPYVTQVIVVVEESNAPPP